MQAAPPQGTRPDAVEMPLFRCASSVKRREQTPPSPPPTSPPPSPPPSKRSDEDIARQMQLEEDRAAATAYVMPIATPVYNGMPPCDMPMVTPVITATPVSPGPRRIRTVAAAPAIVTTKLGSSPPPGCVPGGRYVQVRYFGDISLVCCIIWSFVCWPLACFIPCSPCDSVLVYLAPDGQAYDIDTGELCGYR